MHLSCMHNELFIYFFQTVMMEDFNRYATIKTSGQLVLDLGSVSTHIVALVAILKGRNLDEPLTKFFLWFLVGTIIFQVK